MNKIKYKELNGWLKTVVVYGYASIALSLLSLGTFLYYVIKQ